MAFEATPPSGVKFIMDSPESDDEVPQGPSPLEAFLGALGACSAMDVISILKKKRQTVTSYKIEVEGVRGPRGEYPRPYTALTIRHILSGEDLDPGAVERAIELTESKYCSVIMTLRESPPVCSEWRIE